jgi:excisionase family DNA binding protein
MTTLVQLSYEDLQATVKNCLKEAINEIRELPVQLKQSDRISLVEALEVTGISKSLIYKLSMKGDIPCQKFGRKLIFSREALLRWMESRTTTKTPLYNLSTDHLAKEARKKI